MENNQTKVQKLKIEQITEEAEKDSGTLGKSLSQRNPELQSKKEAFENFKKQHPDYEALQENHQVLRGKYEEAKKYSELANQSRDQINGYKALIEQLRVERAMQGLLNKNEDKNEKDRDPEEERTKNLIEKEKAKYKENYEKLQRIKSEIDTLQAMIKSGNTTIQKDFLNWYNLLNRDSDSQKSEATPSQEDTKTSQQLEPILTGNSEADEEIKKFWSMRNQMLRNSQQ